MNVPVHYKIVGSSASEIAARIEQEVRESRLTPGTQLPTVRCLARRLRLSPATVAAAYQRLRARGLVVAQGRRGTRITYRPPLPTRSPAEVPAGLRNLADGNPDPRLLPRLPRLRQERRARLYGEGAQLPALVQQARRQFAADGLEADLAVVSGGLDGIERVLQAHLAPGDRVAVEDPGFTGVFDLLSVLGLAAEPVRVDDDGPLPGDLRRALGTSVTAFVVTPRAQNPTGAAIGEARAHDLRGVLEHFPHVLVIEDDHAGPISGAPARTLCPRPQRWSVIRSVSKFLGPDLRLAVVTGDPGTIARVEGRQRLGMGWVSHVLQRSVAALGADRRVIDGIRAAAEAYATRRTALVAALRRRGIAAHGRSGLNVWIPLVEEAAAVAALAERGWAVRAGEPYRIKSPPAIRVTVSALKPDEAERFADDLAASLHPLRPSAATR